MPSAERIKEIFSHIEEGFGPSFFDNVADDVSWTVTGVDNPIGGHYPSKAEIIQPYKRVGSYMEGRINPKIRHLLIGDDGNSAAIEFTANGKPKTGGYFQLEACWVCKFAGDKIVEVRGYMDSAHMKKILDANE